jgi:peptide/nickel transport system permease protein
MGRYILQRFLGMLTVMFVVVTIVFLIVRVAPGDPAGVMLGPDATPADVAALRARLGLDQPLLVQYVLFLGQLARGDLGDSIFLNQPVLSALAQRAEPTFFLTLFSILIASSIAIPIFLTRLTHLVLPAIALGIVSSALILRFTRASMLDVLGDDYVRTARSKGMGEFRVVMKHAFKNALIPILTVLGLTAALLVSGAVVTETVFGLPGVGSLVVSAVLRRDYPVIQGALLVIAALYVLINFLIDMLYLAIDPRVRY